MKYLKILLPFILLISFSTFTNAQAKKVPVKKKPVTTVKKVVAKPIAGIRVKLTTDSGIVIIRLYDSTPLHRDNFVKLAKEHFFDSLLFHRVIKGFMIQGGDPTSRNAQSGQMLGMGGSEMEMIPAELKPTLFHKKGALAAASNGNPAKASNACQFYIVHGRKFSIEELNMLELQKGVKFSQVQRNFYSTIGGYPPLDQNYTVFGEVEKGLNIIDKIAAVPTATGDRPIGDVRMKIEILK